MEIGDYRIEIIPDTEFKLDGGAMFGVVPRVLWEKVSPPDELNRVRLNMNCLFVETPTERILIDTGIGEKWSEKQTAIYGIFRQRSFAETLFEKTSCKPEDISIVVNTHLHFDHAGGNTVLREAVPSALADGCERETLTASETLALQSIPQFPNARYFVSRSEFEHAENPHERDKASYLPENWQPLAESGQLELKPDNYEVVEGLSLQNVRGHSKTMQTVCLKRGGETLYGFADLIPTRHHLALPWIMGYDLFPTETLEFKRQVLPQAVKENWLCLFYHETDAPLCRLEEIDGKFMAVEYAE